MASTQYTYNQFLDTLVDSSNYFTIRAAAARNLRFYRNHDVVPRLFRALEEDLPVFDLPIPNQITRDWLREPLNNHNLLNAVRQTTHYYEMKIAVVRTLRKIPERWSPEIIIRELRKSFRTDNINLVVRRSLFLLSSANRRVLDKVSLIMNRTKVGLQKLLLDTLGLMKAIDAIDILFQLYHRGTSRLWREALESIDQIDQGDATVKLLDLYSDHYSENQQDYLQKLFLKRDLIPFLNEISDFNLQVQNMVYNVLVMQGAPNIPKLEFLYDHTKDEQKKAQLKKILEQIQPKFDNQKGYELLL